MEKSKLLDLAGSVRSGVYRHFKGNHYFVLGVGRHSETDELVVVYMRLYAMAGIPLAVRPLESFLAPAMVGGTTVARFEFVGIEQTE